MADAGGSHERARTDDHPGDGVARGTGRMEAFADAVLAIAFTLPIVEIPVPEPNGDYAGQLASLWPHYVGYALSSLIIGVFWAHHHFSGAIYRTTGHWFNLATVLFLAVIGFIAYPARVFGEHLADPVAREDGAIFLACALAAASCSWLLKWTVGRRSGHVDDRLDPAYVDRLDRMYLRSTLASVASAALSFVWWPAGLALAAALTARYMLPPETPVYRAQAPTVEGE